MPEHTINVPTEVVEVEHKPIVDPEVERRRRVALTFIRKFGDPVLRTRALEVERFDDHLKGEVDRMAQIMNDAIGVGLAATQLGIMHRVFTYWLRGEDQEKEGQLVALVNPDLEWASDEKEVAEEGCLSLPGIVVDVERSRAVRVRAFDPAGEEVELEAAGLEARVIQHEIDHIDGILIVDRTTPEQRKLALRHLREGTEMPLRKEEEEEEE